MFIDLSPLKNSRDYRLLFLGQTVSFFGSMVSYVAVPYQVYELSKSSLVVGLIGSAQLIPMIFFSLLGGSIADAMDRKKLLLYSELVMSLACLGLVINALFPAPSIPVIFALVVVIQSALGFHRPAMEAMSQQLVAPEQYPAIAALGSLRFTLGSVMGPALGGALISFGGAKLAYTVDFLTFLWAVALIWQMQSHIPPPSQQKEHKGRILEALRFAVTRPVLMGTYIIDIVAMTFAFPTALFPALAQNWGGASAAGTLFSAMSLGAFLVAILSGKSGAIKRHGVMVVVSAALWGLAIVGLGLAPSLALASIALVAAGALDGISALYRGVIWNETIPNEMRGRMAGLEMISYMTGPLLGNTRAGLMAGWYGNSYSIISGGILCLLGVTLTALFLPSFWKYRSDN